MKRIIGLVILIPLVLFIPGLFMLQAYKMSGNWITFIESVGIAFAIFIGIIIGFILIKKLVIFALELIDS